MARDFDLQDSRLRGGARGCGGAPARLELLATRLSEDAYAALHSRTPRDFAEAG